MFTNISIMQSNPECKESQDINKAFESQVSWSVLEDFIVAEKSAFETTNSLCAVPAKRIEFVIEKTRTDEALAQLHQLGILNFDNFISNYLNYLQNSASLIRDVKLLDKMNSRETIKVSIIYIGPFCETEKDILAQSSETSKDYREFVQSLGWTIETDKHSGYLGGLDKSWTKQAIYHCTPTIEMIFHDITKLPNNDSDRILRMKHIGNDHVHIVWNESFRDYKKTISGDFGNVSIVISPLSTTQMKIDILKDHPIDTGPLLSSCIVPRDGLGEIVRETVIRAHRSELEFQLNEAYVGQAQNYKERCDSLNTIFDRHSGKGTFEEMMHSLCKVKTRE